MRIVAKIATAGTAALSRFPLPNAEIEDCLAADGRLDEAKARKALDVDQIQIASTDDRRVVAFAMEYLKQTRAVVEHLAAPQRNCDVGTAEEQKKRFSKFCTEHTDSMDIDGWQCDKECPLYKNHPNCRFAWAQMPYEKGGAK